MSTPRAAGQRYGLQLALVALLSLGKSAVYAVVDLADTLSRGPLADAQAQLNTSASARPWFDLLYQLLGIGFTLVPVVLALYFMSLDRLPGRDGSQSGQPHPGASQPGTVRPGTLRAVCARIGFDARRPGGDLARGALLFIVIGVGTLGVYFLGRSLGVTAEIQTNNLGAHWWTVPVLILAAVKNGVLEEVLLLGFCVDRLRRMGAGPWVVVLVLAVFRASYHLYQGIGPFVGNVAMGVIFGWLYLRKLRAVEAIAGPDAADSEAAAGSSGAGGAGAAVGVPTGWGRVMPFVVAHTLIDAAGFLAPGILAAVDPR
ncbi:CPBP family intramembrane glutamic endopeptidase [Brevibacterium moorei]|uniref:CPBP family intramembrane glutamic endopeptidase n=1 Tax=Brevibacterium moorei TaxID=2968457 RepID=UPI00211B8892|nr:CPBP family intramembrane glutamic endopeptidase [Brevibacterium sp. 68QC2CO]MCQ9385399.1 CPBP family intramembrane metalloprotease [Brevibacterium sp. 68QC2CO]